MSQSPLLSREILKRWSGYWRPSVLS